MLADLRGETKCNTVATLGLVGDKRSILQKPAAIASAAADPLPWLFWLHVAGY